MKRYLLTLGLFISAFSVQAQENSIDRAVSERLQAFFLNYVSPVKAPAPQLKDVQIDYKQKTLRIEVSESFAYQPWTEQSVEAVYKQVQELLPGPVYYFRIRLYVAGTPIEELVPNFYRHRFHPNKDRLSQSKLSDEPAWVTRTSRPYDISSGLQGRHVAVWQSHGRYYKNERNRWEWQRPPLFGVTEDLFTQAFIVPYLIPMLERAGAVVYTPRERDTQRNEVIVDNDVPNGSLYLETNNRQAWATASVKGFAQRQPTYQDGENPFVAGSCRWVATTRSKKRQAFAQWAPTLPQAGSYAVYVSYQSLPNSVDDARYTVFHRGGTTDFVVNQRMGGGTWVYLGTFEFDAGNNEHGRVLLSNLSRKRSGVVCADAVRFGGGMGNIERGGSTSGLPRYLEGARYSAQWAGFPYEVYAGRKGENDYADDINVRSNAVNLLSGGSAFNPNQVGKRVPLEMTLGLHTDAGYSKIDDKVGSLGIYTTAFNNGRLADGTDRLASRDLSDLLLSQLQKDITSAAGSWNRRSLWDRNYSETRLPAVPSTIVELLSHQNFADMKLGHDPYFQFTASRSLYKAILRFLTHQQGKPYVIQPLPVENFAIRFGKKRHTLELSWTATSDPTEPSANPQGYIVYTRIGQGGFDNGIWVSKPHHRIKIEPGLIYSFRIAAVNHGGESFPSETLSAYLAPHERGRVLIVNGFDRLSGPQVVNTPDQAGFDLESDPGVAYGKNISYCGPQTGFLRSQAGKETEGGWGYSTNDWVGLQVAGNTFDYPYLHGSAIQAVGGYSFTSCSDEAVENGFIHLTNYPVVDYILGVEKAGTSPLVAHKTFSPTMQHLLTQYCREGRNLFVSGAYIGSDMVSTAQERQFTREVLKFEYSPKHTPLTGGLIEGMGQTFRIEHRANEVCYAVPSPDCILPTDSAFSAFLYTDGRQGAGIAYKGKDYRVIATTFPLEAVQTTEARFVLMKGILRFFEAQ